MNNGVRKKALHEPRQSCSESDSGSPPHVPSAAPPVSRRRIKRTACRGAKPSSMPGAQAESTMPARHNTAETVELPPPSPNEHVNLDDPEVGVNPFSTNLDSQRVSSDTIGVHKGDSCGEKRKQSQVAGVLQEHVDFRKKQTRAFVDEPDRKTKPKDDCSIKNCLVVLESIEELSDEEKALAISIFKCELNREIFVNFKNPNVRLLWIRGEIPSKA
ncbi:hypothetical protein ABZP36_000078 [Zizania latifolia]